MEPVLEVSNLVKYFGKKQILKDVSFSINEGEILGFIGPNGAGKTTTIKLILGLQSINSGTVKLNGYDLEKDFEKAIASVGAIVESPDMYMYLSGRKNLELVANMYKNVEKSRIDEVIKLVGLEKRINDKVSKYSLGMRQRLGIAVALLHKPKLLILDEPTNGLDPEGIKELRDLMKDLAKKENTAILISSHNLSELESFCTNVCLIQNGEVISTSTLKELKKVDKNTFVLKLDTTKEVKKLLNKDDKVINDNHIMVKRKEEEIPDLIKKLIKEGYKIYRVQENTVTLEEAFLKKTGGNIID